MNSRIRDCVLIKYFEVYCHGCNQWLDLGDLDKREANIHCLLCETHLGYIHDIPKRFRKLREDW